MLQHLTLRKEYKMKTIAKKTFTEIVLLIVLGLTCCCVVACGNSEEKKIQVEDKTPPVISNVKLFDITSTGAQISWETDEPALGEVIWDLIDKVSRDSKSIVREELATIHSLKITALSPSTKYYYWVVNKDASGNWFVSKVSTFTTLSK